MISAQGTRKAYLKLWKVSLLPSTGFDEVSFGAGESTSEACREKAPVSCMSWLSGLIAGQVELRA